MNIHLRLLRQARTATLELILMVILALLGGLLTIFQAYILSRIISQVFLEGKNLSATLPWLWGLLGIILGRGLLTLGKEVSSGSAAAKVKTSLRDLLLQHLFDLGPAYTAGEHSGELSAVLVEGIEGLDAYFNQYLPQLILAALLPLMILGFVFRLDPLTGVIFLITAPLIPLFMILIGSVSQTVTRRRWMTLSRMSAFYLDTLQGLTTLKILNRSQTQVDRVSKIGEHYRSQTMKVLRVTFLSALVLELVATISTALVAVEIGLRLLYQEMAYEPALFLLVITPEFYLPLRLLGQYFHASMQGVTAARRIFELLDTEKKGTGKGLLETEYLSRHQTEGVSLELKEVTYTYPGRNRPAVENISFRCSAGQQVALVGESGAGKSTIASLLLRLIQPDEGTIIFNDQPLHSIPLHEWHNQIAWVPQQPYLFYDTLAANISLGKPRASQEEIRQAAHMAFLNEWIESLPQGYNTMIGERGYRLSGGQAQRLALARAFLVNAPILVMDEPTAYVDPQQEELLQEATFTLLRGRMVIIIAHRLPTVYQSDQILVLHEGHLVEKGKHGDLYRQGGIYYRLLQAYGGMA